MIGWSTLDAGRVYFSGILGALFQKGVQAALGLVAKALAAQNELGHENW